MQQLRPILIFGIVALHLQLAVAQQDTLHLSEINVASPLWEKASVGQNRIVLTKAELNTHNDASLANEVAIGTPVNITGTGYGLLANPVIRGTHANGTQVYWNGMPVNSPTLGTSDLNLFRSSAFNQISIIPGGGGAELGGGTMGGAILLSRQLDFDGENQLSLGGALASFGEKAFSGGYGFSNKKWALQLGISHFKTDNDFDFQTIYGDEFALDNAAIESFGAYASAGRKFEKSSFETHLMWQSYSRQIPDSRSIYNPKTPSDALEEDRQLRWQNTFQSQRWRVEQGFNIETQTYRDLRYFINDTNNFSQSSTEIEYQVYKSKKVLWTGGGYFNYFAASGSNINQHQSEYGLRSSLAYRLRKDLLLKVALAESFLDDKAMAFLPLLAAEYLLNSHWILKAKAGKVFSVPTLNQRYWPGTGFLEIKPESGWNFETSLAWEKQQQRISLALYYNYLRNKVVWLPAPLGSRPQNYRGIQTPGVELLGANSLRISAFTKLMLRYSLNYTKPTISESYRDDDATIGKTLIYIPTFTADLSVKYKFKNLLAGMAGEYNNGSYASSDNTPLSRLDDFLLIGCSLEYSFGTKIWELRPGVEIANLLNEDYELYLNRPMPGRVLRFFLTLNYKI